MSYPELQVLWSPPRWQEGPPEQVDDALEVEVEAVHRREAVRMVQEAADFVDPDRKSIKLVNLGYLPFEPGR